MVLAFWSSVFDTRGNFTEMVMARDRPSSKTEMVWKVLSTKYSSLEICRTNFEHKTVFASIVKMAETFQESIPWFQGVKFLRYNDFSEIKLEIILIRSFLIFPVVLPLTVSYRARIFPESISIWYNSWKFSCSLKNSPIAESFLDPQKYLFLDMIIFFNVIEFKKLTFI